MDGGSLLRGDVSQARAAEPQTRIFSLNLFGDFELFDTVSGARVAVTARKARALIAYLALAPGCTASRTALATLLWGDAGDEQARQSLRQALSGLRRIEVNGVKLLRSDDEAVQLDDKVLAVDGLDLLAASEHADFARLKQVCASYKGPFGAGLEIEAPGFDEWLRAERQRFADRAVVLYDRLVAALAHSGRHQDALLQANALLAINPIREATHRTIIALEAQVSGRAAAMLRFETFRLLLRDELAVRPEPATYALIDGLRDPPGDAAPNGQPDAASPSRNAPPAAAAGPGRFTRRQLIGMTAALLAMLAIAALGLLRWSEPDPRSADDRRYGRALVALDSIAAQPTSIDLHALEREAALAFSRNARVSLIGLAEPATRKPDYRIRSRLVPAGATGRVDIALVGDGGETVWSGSIPVGGGPATGFARELYGYVTSEIVLREAGRLALSQSIPAKLWRARAAQIRTRLGTEDPAAEALYREVTAEDPGNVVGLLGLSDCLILRVARNQSTQRAADIAAIGDLLVRVKPLIPNSSDIAFKEGMLAKLQGNFEQASSHFEHAVRLDPAHWNAAAQYAHVMIFLGRLQDGFALMQAATPNLLPDLGAAETAYIAGETALMAGHDAEAVRYLGMAVSGNPTVGRIHALYAAALFRAGRLDEARIAAGKAQQLSPAYTPDVMNQRGGRTADPRYVNARGSMVEAFRQARALE